MLSVLCNSFWVCLVYVHCIAIHCQVFNELLTGVVISVKINWALPALLPLSPFLFCTGDQCYCWPGHGDTHNSKETLRWRPHLLFHQLILWLLGEGRGAQWLNHMPHSLSLIMHRCRNADWFLFKGFTYSLTTPVLLHKVDVWYM